MRRRIFQMLFNGDTLPSDMTTAGGPSYVGGVTVPAATTALINAVSGSSMVVNQSVGAGTGKVIITLNAVPVAVTDALAYAGLQLLTFPAGRVQVNGCTASLQWAVTSVTRAATINDSASLTWALGSVTASNITLTSTMIDMMAKATKVLSAATTALNTASTGFLAAASAQFDGTSTSTAMFLNVGFETNTDIDADGSLSATGTITFIYSHFGDY